MYQLVTLALIVYCRDTTFFMYNVYFHDLSSHKSHLPSISLHEYPGHRQHKSNFTLLTFTDIHLKMYQHYVHTSLGTPLHTATLLTTHFHCTFPPVNADQHTTQRCKVPRLPFSLCCVWHSHDISVPNR
jgi:hypothetical protein